MSISSIPPRQITTAPPPSVQSSTTSASEASSGNSVPAQPAQPSQPAAKPPSAKLNSRVMSKNASSIMNKVQAQMKDAVKNAATQRQNPLNDVFAQVDKRLNGNPSLGAGKMPPSVDRTPPLVEGFPPPPAGGVASSGAKSTIAGVAASLGAIPSTGAGNLDQGTINFLRANGVPEDTIDLLRAGPTGAINSPQDIQDMINRTAASEIDAGGTDLLRDLALKNASTSSVARPATPVGGFPFFAGGVAGSGAKPTIAGVAASLGAKPTTGGGKAAQSNAELLQVLDGVIAAKTASGASREVLHGLSEARASLAPPPTEADIIAKFA